MSSKIYFKKNNHFILKKLVRFASDVYYYIHPSGAQKYIRRLLTSPQKSVLTNIPDNIVAHSVATQYGELMTYSIGKGPTILFIHGWSGSGSQFFNLMRSIAKQGYRAVTYDQYKHGRSGGKESNYPLFIHALSALEHYLYNTKTLVSVVSHSMGASAALDFFKERSTPHFLISPLFNFYDELKTRVTNIGLSPILFEKILTAIENDYDIPIKGLNNLHDICLIKRPISIIHSESDQFAPYHFSKSLSENNENIQLHTIDNIGHMRIIDIPKTKNALDQFLKAIRKPELLPT